MASFNTHETTDSSTNGQGALTSTSFTIAAGESVVCAFFWQWSGSPDLTLGASTQPDYETADRATAFSNYKVRIGIWEDPGAGTYDCRSSQGFIDQGMIIFTVTGLDTSTYADGETSSNGQSITDTGTFNVSSATNDLVVMACLGSNQPMTGDQTEVNEAQVSGDFYFMAQYAAGAATVDIGSAFDASVDQAAWMGLNLLDSGGGGGGSNFGSRRLLTLGVGA